MGLRLFFWTNFSGAMFIQGAMFIPDSRVYFGPFAFVLLVFQSRLHSCSRIQVYLSDFMLTYELKKFVDYFVLHRQLAYNKLFIQSHLYLIPINLVRFRFSTQNRIKTCDMDLLWTWMVFSQIFLEVSESLCKSLSIIILHKLYS